jgi:hypothetical protein
MPYRPFVCRRIASPLWISAFASIAAAPAMAQDATLGTPERIPYYFGVSQAFSHESNVYRTPTNEVSETLSTTSLLVGVDQLIGRQRLYGDVSVEANRYPTTDSLDNESYAVTGGLDWETIEFLSGTMRYAARNSLADFGTLDGSTVPSDQTTQEFLASIRYGLNSRLSLNGSYEHRDLKYSNDIYANRNYKQDTVSAGVRWGNSAVLTFGLGYRATKGRTPQFQATPPYEDELERQDIDLTSVWVASGFSILNARISSTKETHTLGANPETSAITGAIAWDYRPTPKLGFTTSITRDTGTETTFLGLTPDGSRPLPVDQSTLSTNVQLQARYEMTSKVSLNGDARYRKGTLSNGEDEKVVGYGLGIGYLPTSSISLSCYAIYENRDSFLSYTATTTTCAAQFTLR